jgi:hypothetical protein
MIAKYLQARFEGYFMCRLATDPDPTNEGRGRSGYTMALTSEEPLDQVIRLQTDDCVERHLRAPAKAMGIKVGVRVTSVLFDGAEWPGSPNLLGAEVRLLGKDDLFAGPIFESRNNVVGSDDSLAFVIVPFQLALDRTDGSGASTLSIRAADHLDPARPDLAIWQIDDPAIYGRRLPSKFTSPSEEVMEALNIFDFYGYFRDRRKFLGNEIARLGAAIAVGAADPGAALDVEEARSRIFQLETWGDRVINKMGFQLQWDFEINGHKSVEGDLGGTTDEHQPWPVSLWFGGWDGDLMIGYARGSLSIPFQPIGLT